MCVDVCTVCERVGVLCSSSSDWLHCVTLCSNSDLMMLNTPPPGENKRKKPSKSRVHFASPQKKDLLTYAPESSLVSCTSRHEYFTVQLVVHPGMSTSLYS